MDYEREFEEKAEALYLAGFTVQGGEILLSKEDHEALLKDRTRSTLPIDSFCSSFGAMEIKAVEKLKPGQIIVMPKSTNRRGREWMWEITMHNGDQEEFPAWQGQELPSGSFVLYDGSGDVAASFNSPHWFSVVRGKEVADDRS